MSDDATNSVPAALAGLSALRHRVGLLLRRRHAGMRLLQAMRIAQAPHEFVSRKWLARRLLSERVARFAIDPRLGYRRLAAGELAGLERVLELSLELRARRAKLVPLILAARFGKHRILFDLLSDAELARQSRWTEFAMGDDLIDAAIDYLGTLPVLRRIGLGLSMPQAQGSAPQHSQLFHLDGEDFAQFKLMVNVTDVGRDDGPFSFLPADASERVIRGAGLDVLRRVDAQRACGATSTPRFQDDEVFRFASPSELVELIGPPGTALLVDTARCLHFGSRIRSGRERLLFAVLYQRYHLINESPHNCIDAATHGADPLRRRLLTQPRERALGTFYPEPSEREPAPRFAMGGDLRKPVAPRD